MAEAASATPFAARFRRAFDQATIIVVTAWQVGAAGTALLAYHDVYSSPALAVGAWLLQLAVIAMGAVWLLRRRANTVMTWSLLAVNLSALVVVLVICPPQEMLRINWTWSTTGLIGVLLLLHRPVGELVFFLAVGAGAVLAALVVTGDADRHDLAGFVTLCYASASIQFAMMAGARVFRFTAGVAADAAAEQAEMATRQAVIAEVAAARRARYREARRLIVPILRGLADGTLDPADPSTRQRCAVAEAMLRRLMTRQEDLPHPLLRGLEDGVAAATRRGAVVSVALVGELSPMPAGIGPALTELPLAVLARTRAYARITVVETEPGHVSVSILADGTAPAPPAGSAGHVSAERGVTVTMDHDGDLLWLETRWQRP
ncbi:hypothetical protein [Actinomadura formosensis]|uniref:hypothetical protein n=1 Tax=Actinomadura formosensis TaxID=60706 RepID=UPI003D91FCBC